MVGPQKENGFTPIANELIEQLYKLPLNGTQFRIILVVFRYTYGFNRKEHELSESFIALALETHKRQIQRELRSLIDMNVLDVVKPATFNSSRVVAFNKYYERWLISRQVLKTTPGDKYSAHTGDGLDASRGGELVTQEIQTKDNIKDSVSNKKIDNQQVANQTPGDEEEIPKPVKRFVKPTLEEVTLYCKERNNGIIPQKWFDYYTANGWKVGKNPMRDWKAAVRTWERNTESKPAEDKSLPQKPVQIRIVER